mgnify:CR=1 FL=1
MSRRLLLSCGEASGDLYAGALVRELRALSPDIDVSGLGGPEFARAGGRVLVDFRGLSVTGFTEIVGKVPQLRAARARLLEDVRQKRVDALVVIDYYGFNGQLARDAHALGLPVIHYISPQIWAWPRCAGIWTRATSPWFATVWARPCRPPLPSVQFR